MITIEKITIRQTVELEDEQARLNLKKLLSEILGVKMVSIEMRHSKETEDIENFKFKGGL